MARCTLCGGKLNSQKRCTFCGLDNSKSDAMYRDMINRNNCDGEPMTHVHEEPKQRIPAQKTVAQRPPVQRTMHTGSAPAYQPKQTTYKSVNHSRKSNPGKVLIAFIPTILVMIGMFVGIIGSIMDFSSPEEEILFEDAEMEVIQPDFQYDQVQDEMPVDGEYYEVVLGSGLYKVGYDLPVGSYMLEAYLGYGDFGVYDSRNNIWMDIYVDEMDETYIEDIRLFKDAYVKVPVGAEVLLISKNAQMELGDKQVNPNVTTYEVEDEMLTGEDVAPGVYDIVFVPKDDGEFRYEEILISTDEGEYRIEYDSEKGEQVFKNMPIPEGACIYLYAYDLDDVDEIYLIPSETISTTDYYEFLNEYWY